MCGSLKVRIHSIVLAASVSLQAVGVSIAQTPDRILYTKTINEVSGGLSDTLLNDAGFGTDIAPLGDLDGNGYEDLAVSEIDGVVWILFMDQNGTVERDTRFGDNYGGIGPDLGGVSVENIGDLDRDGVPEIAIGSYGLLSDNGYAGGLWILFLGEDGTAKSLQKIDSNNGNGPPLQPGDRFGNSVAAIGDLNGDDIPDMAVSAPGDSSGGAFYLLFMKEDGTIASYRKVAPAIPSGSSSSFDMVLANLGDLDGPGGAQMILAVEGMLGAEQAIWLFGLNGAGDVLGELPLAAGVNGLTTSLLNIGGMDSFGDVEGDGTLEVLVSTTLSGDGQVLLLSLSPTGIVVAEEVVRSYSTTSFDICDGASLAVADFDSDGRNDMIVGDPCSPVSVDLMGYYKGDIQLYSLNDGTVPQGVAPETSWTGAVNSQWSVAANWDNGVPTPGTLVKVPEGTPPLIVSPGLTNVCGHLYLEPNATISVLPSADLDAHEGATIRGRILGDGEARLLGMGVLAGAGTVTNLTIETPAVMQGGPMQVLGDLTVSADFEVLLGGQITVAGASTFVPPTPGAATLSGHGLLDLNGPVEIQCQASGQVSPTLRLSDNLRINSNLYVPTSGRIIFDAAGSQNVSQVSFPTGSGGVATVLHNLDVLTDAQVSFLSRLQVTNNLFWNGSILVAGDALLEGDIVGTNPDAIFITTNGGDVEHTGSLFDAPGIMAPQGGFDFGSGSTTHVDNRGSELLINFGSEVNVLGGTDLIVVDNSFGLLGDLNVIDGSFQSENDLDLRASRVLIGNQGTLTVRDNRVSIPNDSTVIVQGKLVVGLASELALSANEVDVQAGGELVLVGTKELPARVTPLGAGGYWLRIRDGAEIAGFEFEISGMGPLGLQLDSLSVIGAFPHDLRRGTFDLVAPGGVLLNILPRLTDREFFGLRFLDSDNTAGANPGTFSTRTAGPSRVLFSDWSGSFGGSMFDDDQDNTAFWGAQLVYLHVREHENYNVIRWRTTDEGDVLFYRLERADQGSNNFDQSINVNLSSNGLYALPDLTITPGNGYRYRLVEVLQLSPLIEKVIAYEAVDGVPNPIRLPVSGPPSSDLLLTSSGSDGGVAPSDSPSWPPTGGRELPSMLVPPATSIIDGRATVLGGETDPLLFDVSDAPLRIEGLRSDQTVVLRNLVLEAGSAGGAALIIADCQGSVLLDEVRLLGSDSAIMISGSSIVLQDVTAPRIELERDSRVLVLNSEIECAQAYSGSALYAYGSQLDRVEEYGGSYEASPLPLAPTQVGPSHRGALEAVVPTGYELVLSTRAEWRITPSGSFALSGPSAVAEGLATVKRDGEGHFEIRPTAKGLETVFFVQITDHSSSAALLEVISAETSR